MWWLPPSLIDGSTFTFHNPTQIAATFTKLVLETEGLQRLDHEASLKCNNHENGMKWWRKPYGEFPPFLARPTLEINLILNSEMIS